MNENMMNGLMIKSRIVFRISFNLISIVFHIIICFLRHLLALSEFSQCRNMIHFLVATKEPDSHTGLPLLLFQEISHNKNKGI